VQFIKKKSIGFKTGVSLAALHLCFVIIAFIAYISSSSSTAGLVFIWFMFLDAPVYLLPSSIFESFGVAAPLISFGILGSVLWFLIPWLVDRFVVNIFPNIGRKTRWTIIIGVIPIILVGFTSLGDFSVKKSIQRERPNELTKMLNSASSDFLTEKVIFEDNESADVSSISLMNCQPNAGTEFLFTLPWGVVFLNKDYQEQHRLKFDENRFSTIKPFNMGGSRSCMFIAYKLFEGVYLYDSEGKEIWRITRENGHKAAIEGVQYGDVDGDNNPEFTIYHSYGEGIHLVDENGKLLWRYPVHALGHLEMADIHGDGKAEIIFSNSNNANGITEFIILDAIGQVAHQLKIPTTSYEFSIIGWPIKESKPNLLLTEENKIRIVDLKGETVFQLNAPGCRDFGKVEAIAVKLKKDESNYLAVKKSLHPDLSVLYIYDSNGKLVYQKTDVIMGVLAPTLTAGPMNEIGVERLIVGAKKDYWTRVLEYSLSR